MSGGVRWYCSVESSYQENQVYINSQWHDQRFCDGNTDLVLFIKKSQQNLSQSSSSSVASLHTISSIHLKRRLQLSENQLRKKHTLCPQADVSNESCKLESFSILINYFFTYFVCDIFLMCVYALLHVQYTQRPDEFIGSHWTVVRNIVNSHLGAGN